MTVPTSPWGLVGDPPNVALKDFQGHTIEYTPTLPSHIKVGFRDYEIHPWPTSEAFAADRQGECDNVNAVIRVEASRNRYDVAHTLIHELLHACFHVAYITAADDEERTISSLAPMLAQVLRDNPELRDYLAAVYA